MRDDESSVNDTTPFPRRNTTKEGVLMRVGGSSG